MKKNIISKKNGFTILEVLFAVVILTFALSSIFVLLNNMFKTVHKIKELSFNIDSTPILYSAFSPLIYHKNIENYDYENYDLHHYLDKHIFNKGPFSQFNSVFIFSSYKHKNNHNQKNFSNIVFITEKKNKKDKNEI